MGLLALLIRLFFWMYFLFLTDNFTCTLDIDECNVKASSALEGSGFAENLDTEPDVCHVNAVCTNTIGSYRCACEEGYEGTGFTCNWRTTTTKAPTTTLTTSTTRKPTTKLTEKLTSSKLSFFNTLHIIFSVPSTRVIIG